jgi:hypothetical protein
LTDFLDEADQILERFRRHPFGVRPLWYDMHAEIPGMIRKLKL